MKRQHIHTIAAAGAALLLAACASDLHEQNTLTAGDGTIKFDATVAAPATRAVTIGHMSAQPLSGYKSKLWLIPSVTDTEAAATRGTQLTSASTLAAFGVSAYKHSNLVDITNAKPDYFYNKRVTKDDVTGKYGFAQDYYWPSNDEYLSFYAYYPYNSMSNPSAEDDNTLVSLTASTLAGPQKVTVTISDDVTQQVDFMTATALNQTPAKTTAGPPAAEPAVALAFQHQLCGIRFKIGDQFPTKGYIQKITLKNVYKQGTYTIGAEAATAWDYGERDDFEVSYSIDRAVTTPGDDVTNESETFLMIPYTFPAENSGASMEIQFWAGDQTYTVTASLDGHVWEAGKTVTYELSSQNLTTLKIQSIGYYQYADATVNNAVPVKAWADGDQVGLYVVQGYDADGNADGRTLRYTNIPCTYNGTTGKWTIDHTTAQGQVIKYPGDSYYFYYPYAEGGPAGYPNECNEVGASAETFFASVITARATNKANYADQSDIASFKLADLQVAKAVSPEENDDLPASTISASMSRQVGLAVITLGTAQANKTVTFTNGVAGTPTKDNVTASSTFSGNIPYNGSNGYYAYVVANSATSFSSATYSSTNKDAWEASLVFNIAAGESNAQTAYSDRKNWAYVNAIWNYSFTNEDTNTGTIQTLTSASQGTFNYTFEVWGAQGGGGRGGYSIGTGSVAASQLMSICVGGRGKGATATEYSSGASLAEFGGYNGGGGGQSGGGGATHIALNNRGVLTAYESYKDEVIIVAGGGGGSDGNIKTVGHGGGLTGIASEVGVTENVSDTHAAGGGTQIAGGYGVLYNGTRLNGSFGKGGSVPSGRYSPAGTAYDSAGAGGGGWFGGGGAPAGWCSGGGGGSGYIGGTEAQTHFGYTAKVPLSDASCIAGNTAFTAPDGSEETGHSGNGYARITLTRW